MRFLATRSRAQVLGHECFHRIQGGWDYRRRIPQITLDGALGRIWMLLEWRAGAASRDCRCAGVPRAPAVVNTGYGGAGEQAGDQRRPGAIYRGAAGQRGWCGSPGCGDFRFARRARANVVGALIRYASGPAYGVLPDESGVAWRKRLTAASDLGETLGSAYRVTAGASAQVAAARYGGDLSMGRGRFCLRRKT